MRAKIFILTLFVCAGSHAPAAEFSDRDPRYKLQPGDAFEIQYRYTPEFNQAVTIQPDGFVSLKLVGELKAQGLSMEELSAELRERAGKRLKDPDLTLVLTDFEKPYVVVGGEVGSPGKFDLRGETTVLQAVAMAGGLKPSSKHSEALLLRRVDREWAEARVIDLKHMVRNGSVAEDIVLRSGDMLIVPQNKVSKIERFVKWTNMGIFWNPAIQ